MRWSKILLNVCILLNVLMVLLVKVAGCFDSPQQGKLNSIDLINSRIVPSLPSRLAHRNSSSSPLSDWFEKHNILYSKVDIFTPENGVRGIFAIDEIPLRYPIAFIPEHMIIQSQYRNLKDLIDHRGSNITAETKNQLEQVSIVLNDELSLDDDCCLLAFRLLELLYTDCETWMPYKRLCLPDRVPNVFSMTTAEVDSFLSNSSASAIAPSIKRAVLAVQEGIARILPNLLILLRLVSPVINASPAELVWALSVVQSRAVKRSTRSVLLPFFDLLNHGAGSVSCYPSSSACRALLPHLSSSDLAAARLALVRLVDPAFYLAAPPESAHENERFGCDGATPPVEDSQLLLRGSKSAGRLGECIIMQATMAVRAGEELTYNYDKARGYASLAVNYGFRPSE